MKLYPKACRTKYAASALKTLLCAALALIMAGLPAYGALAADAAGSQVRVSSGFDADLESWFRQNHPELTCVNLYDGEVVRTDRALALLGGSEPVDMLAVHSSDCDIAAILSSGLVEDLSSNEAIRQRAAELYEPVARLTVTEDGAILGVNGVSGWAMHRIPAAWEAAGLSDADVPQSFTELLDFAQRWIELVQAGKVGNVRLHTLKTWGVPPDETRYTLWLMDLLWNCWAMRQQEAGEAIVFDMPEFVDLADRSREIGRALVKAEKKPGKKSLSLYDCGLNSGMGYGADSLYSNAFPMRISTDEPVRIKAHATLFVVRKGSPHAQACMEYIAHLYASDDASGPRNPELYRGVAPGQIVPPEGSWPGYVLTAEWQETYRPDWLFFLVEPFGTVKAYAQQEKLLLQFAKGEISAQELAYGLDQARAEE